MPDRFYLPLFHAALQGDDLDLGEGFRIMPLPEELKEALMSDEVLIGGYYGLIPDAVDASIALDLTNGRDQLERIGRIARLFAEC